MISVFYAKLFTFSNTHPRNQNSERMKRRKTGRETRNDGSFLFISSIIVIVIMFIIFRQQVLIYFGKNLLDERRSDVLSEKPIHKQQCLSLGVVDLIIIVIVIIILFHVHSNSSETSKHE